MSARCRNQWRCTIYTINIHREITQRILNCATCVNCTATCCTWTTSKDCQRTCFVVVIARQREYTAVHLNFQHKIFSLFILTVMHGNERGTSTRYAQTMPRWVEWSGVKSRIYEDESKRKIVTTKECSRQRLVLYCAPTTAVNQSSRFSNQIIIRFNWSES